ncbi:MAG TPA: MBL fold metallo-hydrolase [Pseudonocardiaceae bacterium]|nr:MBL fold metallo-hydrolase [Pseudonocardiaceae bacterium]
MSSIEFWGGLGVIGSSKIMVSDGDHRVLLDIGMDIPSGGNLFRAPVTERPGRELADRLRVGGAPRVPGLFDPAALPIGDPLREPLGEDTQVFVSHPHIDHVGLAGFVRPEVPVHAHADAVGLMRALTSAGAGLPGGNPAWHALRAGDTVTVGPMRVECVPVDHDVPGATGYLVHTASGTLAYTGDIRFHGRHSERSWEFAERAAGCDVLVTEATTLSFPAADEPVRTESDVVASFVTELRAARGLVLLQMYPRDVERVTEFVAAAKAVGRVIVWPDTTATMLEALGVTVDRPGIADVRADPVGYVVQVNVADLPSLLDLPLTGGEVFVHANGEPLGEFDPRWPVFADWLTALDLTLRRIGTTGHATPEHLHEFVARVAPRVVCPIHTFEPARLFPPHAVRRVIPRYGVRYEFDGSVRQAAPVP